MHEDCDDSAADCVVSSAGTLVLLGRRLAQVVSVDAPYTTVNVDVAPGPAPLSAPVSSSSVNVDAPGTTVNVAGRRLLSAIRRLAQVSVTAPYTSVSVPLPPSPGRPLHAGH